MDSNIKLVHIHLMKKISSKKPSKKPSKTFRVMISDKDSWDDIHHTLQFEFATLSELIPFDPITQKTLEYDPTTILDRYYVIKKKRL